MITSRCFTIAPLTLVWMLGCGGSPEAQSAPHLEGTFASPTAPEGQPLQYSIVEQTPAVADVKLKVGELSFDAHFDYDQRKVFIDGHGQGVDRDTHRLLFEAIGALGTSVNAAPPSESDGFVARALSAALVVWEESGGIVLGQRQYELPAPRAASQELTGGQELTDKSLADDGIECIKRGQAYDVSFDYGDVTVSDLSVVADSHSCNGLCGPACVLLTPFPMWTLDCLEHDECCAATDGGPECWVPLGECADEYDKATAGFLLGADPFASHCGG